MDLRQFEHFVVVAQERSFTRAAARLGISQPGLSASVQALEGDAGMPLLERTTRQVLITPAGQAMLESAQRILGEVATARRRLAGLAGLESGRLAVGVVQTFTTVDLPDVLAALHRRHPGVQVTLREAPTADLLVMVRGGDLDLAFVALDATPLPEGMRQVRGYHESIVVIVGEAHRLARRSRIRLADLAGEVFVDFQAGQGLQTVIEQVCADAGLKRTIGFGVGQMDQVVSLVGHGLGVALVPEPIAEASGLPTIRLSPHPPKRRLALVSRAQESANPAVQELISRLPD